MGPYYIMGNESRNYKPPSEKSKKTQRKPRGAKKTREEILAYGRAYSKRRYAEGSVKPKTPEQIEQKKKSIKAWHEKKKA
jgi:hypothetical protein